jgi:UrcA family protein
MTSHSLIRATATVLASCALALTATLSHAATPDSSAQTVSVSYSDLNVSTDEGSRELYQRLVAAARQVCPSNLGPSARQLSESRHCVAAAVDRAMSEVQGSRLAQVHATHAR